MHDTELQNRNIQDMCAGTAEGFRLAAEYYDIRLPENFKIIGCTGGAGGTSIADLSKGSVWYEGLLQNVRTAKESCDAAGLSMMVPCFTWTQGEEDMRAGTEEIFTMPHKDRAEGTLVSALPLCYRGNLIRNFSLTFREGRVVEYHAEEGEEILKSLLEGDEGSKHLGEVAIVPYSSPISQMKTLFYNTLFDENASCHFALGECYPTTIQGGAAMSEEELAAAGGNSSMNHEDFMVGTADLKITGIRADGEQIVLFENGDWVI